MSKIPFDGRMNDFYGKYVHSHIYNDYDASYDKYHNRIKNELNVFGVSLDSFHDKVVLDVGTGAQSIVLSKFGCNSIHHYDINQEQVTALKKYIEENKIQNIYSTQLDINERGVLFPEFDYAIIIGVYHHLSEPLILLDNLLKAGKAGSRIFIRCYRSGTWSRWLVSMLRELRFLTNIESVVDAFVVCYPLENNMQFLSDMIDDVFVPTWGAYNPEQFISIAKYLEIDCLTRDKLFDVDFTLEDENFRVMLKKTKPYDGALVSNSLFSMSPVDQSKLVGDSIYMPEIVVAWQNYKDKLQSMSPSEVALRLIALYRLTRKISCMDYFTLSQYRHNQALTNNFSDKRLKMFLRIISF